MSKSIRRPSYPLGPRERPGHRPSLARAQLLLDVVRHRFDEKAALDDPAIDDISTADLLGDYPAVQYNPPDATFHIDILTRLGDAYAFADLNIERIALDELTVSVVTPQTLYEMKRDTIRLKDKADAHALKERFGLKD